MQQQSDYQKNMNLNVYQFLLTFDLNGINQLFTNFDKYNDNLDILINNGGCLG